MCGDQSGEFFIGILGLSGLSLIKFKSLYFLFNFNFSQGSHCIRTEWSEVDVSTNFDSKARIR